VPSHPTSTTGYSNEFEAQPAGNLSIKAADKMQKMKEQMKIAAATRLHGTKNLAGVFLVVGALVALTVGGNLPVFSFQGSTIDRPYVG